MMKKNQKKRNFILEKCANEKTNKIIITHGTDTMIDTAKTLANKITNKIIILTGAMIPIKFGSSDGLFNLGAAIGFVQSLNFGVYIAMNGKCFNYNEVIKNSETGEFESKR